MTVEEKPQFKAAYPYADSVLTLPVKDIAEAAAWYANAFGLQEVERRADSAQPAVVLERDGVRLGFEENGGNPENEGAAILVAGIEGIRREFEANGVPVGEWRIDERDGKQLRVFFVVAPDGLCYYFHQPVDV